MTTILTLITGSTSALWRGDDCAFGLRVDLRLLSVPRLVSLCGMLEPFPQAHINRLLYSPPENDYDDGDAHNERPIGNLSAPY